MTACLDVGNFRHDLLDDCVVDSVGTCGVVVVGEQLANSKKVPKRSLRGADMYAFSTNDGATILDLLGPLLPLRNSIVSSPALSTGMRRGDCGGAVSGKRNSRHEAQERSGDIRGLQQRHRLHRGMIGWLSTQLTNR